MTARPARPAYRPRGALAAPVPEVPAPGDPRARGAAADLPPGEDEVLAAAATDDGAEGLVSGGPPVDVGGQPTDDGGREGGPRADDEDGTEEAAGGDLDLGEAAPASVRAGVEVIRRFHRTLPTGPGVYRMIGANGDVLYVGKAKNLRARVASYTRLNGHVSRIARMIAGTASMEFVTTSTEMEALLLETNLIKQLKPRFNVLMRDDKSLPYILVAEGHAAPQLTKHRGARNRKGAYFGPFASTWAVNRTLNALQRAFLLRSCTDSFFEARTRPCLLYQIKRCAGPCTGEVLPDDYAALVGEAKAFLTGKSRLIKERFAAEMQLASHDMEFERAARLRDRLAALSAIQGSQDINPQGVEEADVFALHEQAGQVCVEVFFFRMFQNWGNRAFFPRVERGMEAGEVLGSFLAQFYDDKPPPRLVLVSHDFEDRPLLEGALSSRGDHRVEVHVPARGEKASLVAHAARNAQAALARRLADTASQGKLLELVAEAFGLEGAPRRVEVYDNSHIMGTNAVGAMVVAGREGFARQHYRTFNIKADDAKPGDDFGMMREVFARRFGRLVKETGQTSPADDEAPQDKLPAWPDLVLVDGGRGQLDAARKIFAELGVEGVALVGVAKGRDRDAGRETFFAEGRPPFRLPPRDPALYFVQRLRDEAHRFAIGAHRAKRSRELTTNPLDEVAGIGPARKRALLLHFGTAKAVGRASLEDLARVPGVNLATARSLYDHFHEGGG